MKAKDCFLMQVKFSEYFYKADYFDKDRENIEGEKFYFGKYYTKWQRKNVYRKIIYKVFPEAKIGIIVGQTTKKEGILHPGTYNGEDSDPGYLDVKKTVPFWIVAIDINHRYLVAKDECEVL